MMAQPSTHHDAHLRRRGNSLLGLRRYAHRIGYNFTSATEPGLVVVTQPRGFYFTISTKLSNLSISSAPRRMVSSVCGREQKL